MAYRIHEWLKPRVIGRWMNLGPGRAPIILVMNAMNKKKAKKKETRKKMNRPGVKIEKLF